MNAIKKFFRVLLSDTLFIRVVMFLWGAPFVALGAYLAMSAPAGDVGYWYVMAVALAFGSFGAFLVYVSVFGSDKAAKRAMDFVGYGFEIPGLAAVLTVSLIAIPVTVILRRLRGPKE